MKALLLFLLLVLIAPISYGAGGYFMIGYGPHARQLAGATTAVAGDAFAGSSNPAKLSEVGDRVDVGIDLFFPYRRVERRGSGTVYDFGTTSDRNVFPVPEGAISRRINDRWTWGVTLYGNGGLNTDYRGTNGVEGSSLAPQCGNRPSNFLFGCDKVGFDILQLVVAPTLAWQMTPRNSVGIAPLFVAQRFQAYGLQAFDAFSSNPGDVTNRGKDWSFGAGVRVGWYSKVRPWLRLGVAYSTKVYMEKFEKYEGLLAQGRLDIPANYSLGIAILPTNRLTFSFDYQRIEYGEVKANGNGILNSLLDPVNNPLGSSTGSGFNWENQDNIRFGLAYEYSPKLVLRTGYAYGGQVQRDKSLNSVTFNMLAPNPIHQIAFGFSWMPFKHQELNFAYTHFLALDYSGPSASSVFGIGGIEDVKAQVNTVMLGWSWKH